MRAFFQKRLPVSGVVLTLIAGAVFLHAWNPNFHAGDVAAGLFLAGVAVGLGASLYSPLWGRNAWKRQAKRNILRAYQNSKDKWQWGDEEDKEARKLISEILRGLRDDDSGDPAPVRTSSVERLIDFHLKKRSS